MRNVRASRHGQRTGDIGDLLDAAEPARQVVQSAGQADRSIAERILHLTARCSPFVGPQRARRQADDVVPDRALRGQDRHVLRQPPRHRVPVAGHAQVARRFERAVDRREVLIEVPRGTRGRADPRFPVLADDKSRHPLGERAINAARGQQRSLGVDVRVDKTRADHAARGQVNDLAISRGRAVAADGGNQLPLDQHVGGPYRGGDPVGDQATAKQHACGHRFDLPPVPVRQAPA